jgi:phosphate starvation-inducible protein PhoH and related proteins
MTKKKYEAPVKQVFMKKIQPKNYTQELYMQCLKNDAVILGKGPAGSGKTFVATSIACEKLINREVSRIVLTRPIVESGEKLGFLPGTLEEKVHPYLLPLLDGLNYHLGPKMVQDFISDGKIEIAPLAYMRGRTFDNCFVILDEAENTTKEQMKLFLTRIGFNTTMAINGDHTQSDLSTKIENGLTWAVRKLKGKSPEISVVEFSKDDIVRSHLISIILTCLESPDNQSFNHIQLNG